MTKKMEFISNIFLTHDDTQPTKICGIIPPVKVKEDITPIIPKGNSCCPDVCERTNRFIKTTDWVTRYKPEQIIKIDRKNPDKINKKITRIANMREILENIRMEMYNKNICKCIEKSGE